MTDPGDDRPPPASGAKTFNQWLGGGVPTAVAGIVIAKLSEYLNLWFVLPALGAAALYGVWKAPTVAHGPLIQRLLTPILVLAYTAFLVVLTVVPDLPPVWQVTGPAALFTAVALTAARNYNAIGVGRAAGIAIIGIGIAVIGAGTAAILDHDILAGIAIIGLGIAAIGAGTALILDHDHARGIAIIGIGIAAIGIGIAILLHQELTFGIAAIGGGDRDHRHRDHAHPRPRHPRRDRTHRRRDRVHRRRDRAHPRPRHPRRDRTHRHRDRVHRHRDRVRPRPGSHLRDRGHRRRDRGDRRRDLDGPSVSGRRRYDRGRRNRAGRVGRPAGPRSRCEQRGGTSRATRPPRLIHPNRLCRHSPPVRLTGSVGVGGDDRCCDTAAPGGPGADACAAGAARGCEWSNYLAHLDRAIWRSPRPVTTLWRAHTASGDRPGRPM